MTKYTQGPWSIRKIQDQITVRGKEVNGLSIEIADINPHINPFLHGYSAEDNARLIACAPELLEALELAYGSMCDAYIDFPNNPKGKLIMAAIARARGES